MIPTITSTTTSTVPINPNPTAAIMAPSFRRLPFLPCQEKHETRTLRFELDQTTPRRSALEGEAEAFLSLPMGGCSQQIKRDLVRARSHAAAST